ncbi:MAG: signal peptidase I [Gemmatimonadales bacterium]
MLATLAALALWTRGCTALPHTYTMTGESMAPTVGRGDWFLARPHDAPPDPGALVIIEHWIDDTLYHVLRRAVGLPGDTLAMRDGRLTVNGLAAPWPMRVVVPAAERTLDGPIRGTIYTWGPVAVGPDSVFVLSDTRDMIGWPDSRFFGPIPIERVVATYAFRLWKGANPSPESGSATPRDRSRSAAR